MLKDDSSSTLKGKQSDFHQTLHYWYNDSTPPIHKRMQFSLFEESNDSKFDQSYIKIIQISTTILIMKYIFVVNLVGDKC